MEYYETLLNALNALRKQGYITDFNTENNYLKFGNENGRLLPRDFVVDKYFRFEGQSDPDDNSILYAISAEKFGIKGVLVNAYGIYSDTVANELIEKLRYNSQ